MMYQVYHGTPWYTRGISRYIMVYHGMSWYTMMYRGIPWYIMVYHGNVTKANVTRSVRSHIKGLQLCNSESNKELQAPSVYHGIPRYTMVYHDIPWYAMVCHGIPWYTMVCHGTPWYSIVFHGIPWHTTVYWHQGSRT